MTSTEQRGLPSDQWYKGWDFFDPIMTRHGRTKIDNNTYLQRDTSEAGDLIYTVILHDTEVLTLDRTNGTATLDSGGYRTRLTLRRLNAYLGHFNIQVVDRSGLWTVVDPVEEKEYLFVDGLVINL